MHTAAFRYLLFSLHGFFASVATYLESVRSRSYDTARELARLVFVRRTTLPYSRLWLGYYSPSIVLVAASDDGGHSGS